MLVLVVVLASLHAAAPRPGQLQLHTDCRFWPEPKQQIADKFKAGGRPGFTVFYYWAGEVGGCLPCTVCPARTLQTCRPTSNSRCGSELEWRRLGSHAPATPLDRLEERLRARQEDEGVVHYKAAMGGVESQEAAVYGVPVYTTQPGTPLPGQDSPTRKIHRKYGGGGGNDASKSAPAPQQFGKPTFYSNDEHKNRDVVTNERPILQIFREILRNDTVRQAGVKDVVNATKIGLVTARNDSNDELAPADNSRYSFQFPGHESMLATTLRSSPPSEIPTTTPATAGPAPSLAPAWAGAVESSHKLSDPWPYRTDDEYSLFYYQQQQQQDGEEEAVPHPWHSEGEYIEVETEQSSEPVTIQSESGTVLPGDPGPAAASPAPDRPLHSTVLERIFFFVAGLVLLLLLVLILIISRNRYRQTRFKLLDNSDGVSSYHSVSPSESVGTQYTVSGTSPLPPPCPRTPSPESTSQQRQLSDRAKLSIPLQPYHASLAPAHVQPVPPTLTPTLHLGDTLIHPSVARSLKNIRK